MNPILDPLYEGLPADTYELDKELAARIEQKAQQLVALAGGDTTLHLSRRELEALTRFHEAQREAYRAWTFKPLHRGLGTPGAELRGGLPLLVALATPAGTVTLRVRPVEVKGAADLPAYWRELAGQCAEPAAEAFRMCADRLEFFLLCEKAGAP